MFDPHEQAYNDDEYWAAERLMEVADESWDEGDEFEDEPDPDAMLEEYHWKLSAGDFN